MKTSEKLKSVLCNPEGKCCVLGSNLDNSLLEEAIKEVVEMEGGGKNQTYYFTFCGDSENSHRYRKIVAKDYHRAREKMFELHGKKWAFQYTEESFKEQPKKYQLTELI